MKNKLISLIAAALSALVLLTGCVPIPSVFPKLFGGRAYAVNAPDGAEGLETAENFYLYSGAKLGFSFQYPKGREVGFSKEDGAYIYCGESTAQPYVLVCRIDKHGMSPEKYFKACDELMLTTFKSVESTPINEVNIGDKTLYLTRYVCDGLVIDRYVELYDKFYIQYTSLSDEADALNTELYYAIATLRVNDGAYSEAYSDEVNVHSFEDIGLSIDIPDMLDTMDLTIGYFASNKDAVMLAVLITEDDNGKTIYNRKDFIDRAAESPGFVAGLLGSESAAFSKGQERDFGSKSFYCYPMDMREGGSDFSGELCLANADEAGCWLVCYAVRKGCISFEDTLGLLCDCAQSINVK